MRITSARRETPSCSNSNSNLKSGTSSRVCRGENISFNFCVTKSAAVSPRREKNDLKKLPRARLLALMIRTAMGSRAFLATRGVVARCEN